MQEGDVRHDAVWDRLERQFAHHAPDLLASLRPPASADALASFEAELGFSLLAGVRHAYLRHDGCEWSPGPPAKVQSLGIFGRIRWLPLEEAREWYRLQGEFFDPAEPYLQPESEWQGLAVRPWAEPEPPGWVPIGRHPGSSLFWLVDTQPGPAGCAGQLVSYRTEGGDNTCWRVANGMHAYLSALADGLEDGSLWVTRINEGLETAWCRAGTEEPFTLPERQFAFGFR